MLGDAYTCSLLEMSVHLGSQKVHHPFTLVLLIIDLPHQPAIISYFRSASIFLLPLPLECCHQGRAPYCMKDTAKTGRMQPSEDKRRAEQVCKTCLLRQHPVVCLSHLQCLYRRQSNDFLCMSIMASVLSVRLLKLHAANAICIVSAYKCESMFTWGMSEGQERGLERCGFRHV